MAPPGLFEDDPQTTREAMIRATSRALCSHGYADLTIEKFGREFEKSPSLIYHHYEGNELLLDFLGFMLERFEADAVGDRGIGPADRLRALVDHLLPERLPEDRDAFQRAMVPLRAQGTHDGEYRAKFCLSEELFHGHLASLLAAGVDVGAFHELDPDRVAAFLLTILDGAMFRRATADAEDHVAAVREELLDSIDSRIIADGH